MQVAHLYKITHLPSGQFYYGKHNGTQQNGYWGGGLRIGNLVKKHGKSEFIYKVLVIGDIDYIFYIESLIVTKDLIAEEKCLNIALGGNGHTFTPSDMRYTHSPEVRAKMSLMKKELFAKMTPDEKAWTDDRRTNIMNGIQKYHSTHKTPPLSEETKQKISATKKANPTGTGKWVNKDGIQKKIKLEDINTYLNDGWMLGTSKKYITEEFKEEQRQRTIAQWQRQKKISNKE